jgi:hypothetical protein
MGICVIHFRDDIFFCMITTSIATSTYSQQASQQPLVGGCVGWCVFAFCQHFAAVKVIRRQGCKAASWLLAAEQARKAPFRVEDS